MKKIILLRITFLINYSLFVCLAEYSAQVNAQDYIGANVVLQQVEERNAKPNPQTNDEQSKLRSDLTAFSLNSSKLSSADAAKQWLELVDRAVKIQQQSARNFDSSALPIQGSDLLNALPPPATWNELAKAIAARPPVNDEGEIREIGLRFMAATLRGNTQAQNLEVSNLEIKASQADSQTAYIYAQFLQQISQIMLTASDDPDTILKSLESQMAPAAAGNPVTLQVPNLISQIGADKAEAFLRKALVMPNVILQFETPNDTSRLAQKLALELVSQLKMPQWSLVNSLDGVELYEALEKRFGEGTNNPTPLPGLPAGFSMPAGMNFSGPNYMDAGRDNARIYYLLGLISTGRTQDAVVIAKKCTTLQSYEFDNAFDAMDRAGYSTELDDFLYQLLSQYPTLPFWNEYVEFSAKAGKTDKMLALVRTTLTAPELTEAKKATLRQIYFAALLADDDVDEGVKEMQRLIATNAVPSESGQNYNKGQLGAMLARIGVLMNNPQWVEAGIAATKEWISASAGQDSSSWESLPIVVSLTDTLQKLNRGPEAESILGDALANATRKGNSGPDYDWYNGGSSRGILATLAVLYYKAGRYDDVLDLLQNAPDWKAKDLSELSESDPWDNQLSVMSLHTPSSSLPISFVAAGALKAKGRIEEAWRITDALLNKEPALDRGYELLVALDGTNAIPHLDELFRRDQFQTRPLIWKAYLLEQENQWEEAEKTIRQAIAIDPSDGESGRGDRMRAYAELADIREARGDQKEADSYREIVKAIRVSEDADQFYMAGLLKRAIGMYEQGLDHFADAYCIQSRLAIQLAALGKTAEASEHYRRAYELMPDSFGRVESHCFGCERVFNGGQAQGIAEKVFTQLVAERPNKPQVYYLLGYLQTEENHYNEAWTNFQSAVRLDPDYLNAWVELQTISRQILVAPAEKNKIAFNILRLDPSQRHSSPDFSAGTDLTHLWNAMAVAVQLQPGSATNLFELTASKITMEKNLNDSSEQSHIMQMEEYRGQNQNLSPAGAVAQTPFVSLAGQLILGGNSSSIDN